VRKVAALIRQKLDLINQAMEKTKETVTAIVAHLKKIIAII
jgi:predicted translin family RNA/ssDNA-binding protein